ncbi:MAG: CNNM domain-containing protein [Limisphaerales bacterium]
MNLLLLFIFVMGLALSFLFSGMESGMLSTNRLALRRRARAGDHSASALMSYLDETESFLWTVLVGNTLANLMIVAPLLLGLRALLPTQPWLSGLSLVLLLLLLYTFCDLFPKLLYRRFPDSLTIGSIGPYRFFHGLLAPVVFLVSGFADLMLKVSGGKALNARLFTNREEMRQVMAHSSQNLTMEEKSMIDRVMDLQSRSLASVMTPMNQTTCLNRDQTILEVVNIAQERALTRFPVLGIQEGKTVVVGAFHLKAMLHDWEKHCDELVGDHLTGVMRLPSELSADEALRKMQASGQRVALVVKADQKELGWVNLRDILKTVFGEVNL